MKTVLKIQRIFLFLLVFNGTAILTGAPSSYQPLMILDCKKSGGIFDEKCFKNIEFVTNHLRDSGFFDGVTSVSNNSFLYRKEGQVYPVTFSDQSFYRKQWFKKMIFEQYESEMSILSDRNQRYAMIYGKSVNTNGRDCSICNEMKDTMNYSKVNTFFYYDKDFNDIAAKNFIRKNSRVQLKYPSAISLSDIHSFNILYDLQQSLYKVADVKIVYSPVNIYSFLVSAMPTEIIKMSPQQNWSRALSFWELVGSRRSGYLDLLNNEMYMDIYTLWDAGSLSANLQKIIGQKLAGSAIEWKIFHESGGWEQKTDDGQMKKINVVHDEKNAPEKSDTLTGEETNNQVKSSGTPGMSEKSH
ncbi:MAG: hypothetical protein OEV66_04785 [Spirochaetia bacterium]|nr:hypothetical protein [Spirochaetia bacterium]